MISVIIPAHNEEAGLGETLRAVRAALHEVPRPHEVIVVDDASTDRTAAIAREHGATVVAVAHRQIAATRNSGARAARGDVFVFVDADTRVDAGVLRAALAALARGAAGGGAWGRLEGDVPAYARLLWIGLVAAGHVVGFTGGAFLFCTRAAFERGGGFNEQFFGGEEWEFALALKRTGPFVVLWARPPTSGRRFRKLSGLAALAMIPALFRPRRTFGRREAVRKIWYESDRTERADDTRAWPARLSNALAFVALIALCAAPVWEPLAAVWPAARHGAFGAVRRASGVFTAHAGLAHWAFAVMFARALLGQTRRAEQARFALLGAVCLGLAWHATHQVAGLWWQLLVWLRG
ncbi:MAG: Poly-beta,6-N-acetyl-D-glucosamine synthase [Verrucomicrobiota bacterium]